MRGLVLVALGALAAPSNARGEGFGPFATAAAPLLHEGAPAARAARTSTLAVSPFYLPFRFYQSVLSPIDGPRCAHRPTCSLYAIQAMRKHPGLGAFLALDRLWRGSESSALRSLPVIEDAGGLHFLDPLEESDFWLR
jgi:hypothetical protein